jgi:hypothetical protein
MGGAMPLSGTFDILDFSEVLRLLARQALTGRLHLRSRAYNANLLFDDGMIVGADQSEHQATATAGDVRGRLEEICFELLEAERGAFEFQPGKVTPVPGGPRLKVESVISRARKRLHEWHELQAVIPSLDIAPQLVIDLEESEITIDRERWRLLTTIDGRRSLRTIGRVLNMSDFDTCRVTRSLMEAGIVELDQRAAALAFAMSPDADGPPVTETVTTVNGKQAVKATSPTPAGERTRARVEAARRAKAAEESKAAAAGGGQGEVAVEDGAPEEVPDADAADADAAGAADGDTADADTGDGHTADADAGDGDTADADAGDGDTADAGIAGASGEEGGPGAPDVDDADAGTPGAGEAAAGGSGAGSADAPARGGGDEGETAGAGEGADLMGDQGGQAEGGQRQGGQRQGGQSGGGAGASPHGARQARPESATGGDGVPLPAAFPGPPPSTDEPTMETPVVPGPVGAAERREPAPTTAAAGRVPRRVVRIRSKLPRRPGDDA